MTARRAWFRCPSSIFRESWDRDTKLTVLWLQAEMIDRWARDGLKARKASAICISNTRLMEITGKLQPKRAREALEELSRNLRGSSVELCENFVRFSWPKFAVFQGLRDLDRAVSAHAPAPAQKTPPTPRERGEPGGRGEDRRPRVSDFSQDDRRIAAYLARGGTEYGDQRDRLEWLIAKYERQVAPKVGTIH